MNFFLNKFAESNSWKNFLNLYIDNKKPGEVLLHIDTLACDEDIWPFVISSLYYRLNKPVFLLTATSDRAGELAREIKPLVDKTDILMYPGLGAGLFSKKTQGLSEQLFTRLEILKRISCHDVEPGISAGKGPGTKPYGNNQPFILIATSNSIIDLIPPESDLEMDGFKVQLKQKYDRGEIIEKLSLAGYERVSRVFDRGEFSFRGDVLDIFEIASQRPVRIDFSEDIAEKIFTYDPDNYTPVENMTEIMVFSNSSFENSDIRKVSIIDFIKETIPDFLFIICDPLEVGLKIRSDIDIGLKSMEMEEQTGCKNSEQVKDAGPDGSGPGKSFIASDYLNNDEIVNLRQKLNLISQKLTSGTAGTFVLNEIRRQKKCLGNSEIFVNNLKKDLKNKKTVVISLQDFNRIKRIEEILTDAGTSFKNFFSLQSGGGKNKILSHDKNIPDENMTDRSIINVFDKNLYSGFESEDFSLYGELDIYEEMQQVYSETTAVIDRKAEEFRPGDFLVHKTHGIGRYIGIVSEQREESKKEYFLIEYANKDRLYVPVWQSDRIHKYIGDKNPVISALNSRQWENLKKKVRSSVHKLAIDLSLLYAERDSAQGFSFTQDSIWQKEMEDLFPFRETGDQVKAIEDVKKFMERPKPMDLLLCGDVGFGKTEVAVRAAFKAMENGKQVLMLVPTTILADQHFRTFGQRYANFPVIVEVISRFKSSAQQHQILKRFEEGRIDMLIGTHRILSEDIKPKDLGLVIIDEEQRFGVNAKEKLKLFKKNVDVLTMSATPIPRTLYMSLTGIREIVLIETHPAGRFPIDTFVGEKDDMVIRMAVEREIKRGGQIYYVHNRVRDINEVAYKLKSLIPGARIALTHGQMEGSKIEKIMNDFLDKKYDILLTTSIIESGMDIGNVNTLIVEDSHRFGLSQLYQIRGRVGRSSEKAYAYFFYPGRRVLNLAAFQRLKTLAEYTDLGSGYKIAMKDLEIRGAGELLGARQHGNMNNVGFDLYCQIVKEEVDRLKGIEVKEDINVQIELPLSSFIPKSFIKNERERINVYKVLGSLESTGDADMLVRDIILKRGKLPETFTNLVDIAKMKCIAKKAGIEQISFSKSRGILFKKISLSPEKIKPFVSKYPNFVYIYRNHEILFKNSKKELTTGLVLNYLNDIIAFI